MSSINYAIWLGAEGKPNIPVLLQSQWNCLGDKLVIMYIADNAPYSRMYELLPIPTYTIVWFVKTISFLCGFFVCFLNLRLALSLLKRSRLPHPFANIILKGGPREVEHYEVGFTVFCAILGETLTFNCSVENQPYYKAGFGTVDASSNRFQTRHPTASIITWPHSCLLFRVSDVEEGQQGAGI